MNEKGKPTRERFRGTFRQESEKSTRSADEVEMDDNPKREFSQVGEGKK